MRKFKVKALVSAVREQELERFYGDDATYSLQQHFVRAANTSLRENKHILPVETLMKYSHFDAVESKCDKNHLGETVPCKSNSFV